MNNERHLSLFRPHSALARVVSLLLLSFIVYGTTVEAAHTHSGGTVQPTAVESTNVSNLEKELSTTTNLSLCGDCLICQLHQQFSASVVEVPPSLLPSTESLTHFSIVTSAFQSPTAAPRTGRAPPESIL